MNALIETALGPLDVVRQRVLRLLLARPALSRQLVRRATRVPLVMALCSVAAFGCATLAPSLQLVWAPIVLGVPHVAADIRYLVLRRALPRILLWATAGFICAFFGFSALQQAGVVPAAAPALEHAIGASWVLFAALSGAALAQRQRSALYAVGAAVGIGICAMNWPLAFRLALVHGHNLIAFVIWLALFRRRSDRRAWFLAFGILTTAALLASGLVLPITMRHGWLALSGLHLFAAADWLAPGLTGAQGVGVAASFAYLQSLHYAAWLVAIPQEDSAAAGSATFRMSWRSWLRDYRAVGSAVVFGLALLVLMAGALHPLRTRHVYIALTSFHAWLELALLAYVWARGRPETTRASRGA